MLRYPINSIAEKISSRAEEWVFLTPVRLFDRGVRIKFPAKVCLRATFANLVGPSGIACQIIQAFF